MNTLSINDLQFNFERKKILIPSKEINFDKLLVIKGQIGSGKTLLLKSIGKIVDPDSGAVSLNHGVSNACFIHSQPEFNFVTGNIADELAFAGISTVGFENYLHKNVYQLSGGELKKLSLKMAIKGGFSALLLDEPLDMADDKQCGEMVALIKECSKSIPIIIATHDSHFDHCGEILYLGSFDPQSDTTFEKVNVKYKSSKPVVTVSELKIANSATSFTLHGGEIMCVFGENGSGKTLLLRELAGVGGLPYAGSYAIDTDYGACLQFPEHMIYRSTVAEEIADVSGGVNVEKVLTELGWEDRKTESPFALSDGEKRIMYIISLLGSRSCCFFDEPFAGLDKKTAYFIGKQFVKARDKGKSILYTANRNADTYLADTIITL